MIYSQWRSEGGFNYFESNRSHPIGDDLPEVSMPPPSGGIGVPAQDVGQPLPSDAQYVGSGDLPEGVMTPMLREGGGRGLGALKTALSSQEMFMVIMLMAMLGAAAWASHREQRR